MRSVRLVVEVSGAAAIESTPMIRFSAAFGARGGRREAWNVLRRLGDGARMGDGSLAMGFAF
jgi:hypothetical protein